MKSPVLYLLEVLFCSGMLLAFYRLLLMRRAAFVHCRRYLVTAVLLSAVIPALNIPVYPARTVTYPIPVVSVAEPAAEIPTVTAEQPETAVVSAVASSVDWTSVVRYGVAGLYLLTVAVSLAIFAAHLLSIRRLRRCSRLTACEGYILAENSTVETPFSFLRTVFLGAGYEGRRRGIVLCHEASHVRHRHSAERIAVECVRCLFWFNPFVWMAARWLQEVQEWEADRDVLDAGYDLTEYRTIIFHQLFGYNPDIASGLNHSLTKNRFAMMTQSKERRFALVRLGAAIPLVAGMMMLCSFTTRTPEPPEPSAATFAADVLPGLEKLTPVEVLTTDIAINTGEESGKVQFGFFSYLPSDDSKYRLADEKIITPLGKDISDWARKHYFITAKNPMFLIGGKLQTKEEFAAREADQYKHKSLTGIQQAIQRTGSLTIYTGAEVGKLTGDSTVDVLVILATMPSKEKLANAHCPLRSDLIGIYGQKFIDRKSVFHSGVDLAADKGTDVAAAADGKVIEAGVDGHWGNCIRIEHADGFTSKYAHLDAMRVKAGDMVKGGQVIGTVGTTGVVTGAHLHFELAKDGKTFDPELLFDFREGRVNAASAPMPAGAAVSRVHIAPDATGKVQVALNGQSVAFDELTARLAAWRSQLPDPRVATAVITVAPGTKMGAVADTKDALRKAKILRVRYGEPGHSDVTRLLPPPYDSKDNGVAVVEALPVKERNVLLVQITGSGAVSAGKSGAMKTVAPQELPKMVRTLIENAEKHDQDICLSNDKTISYPVSEGFAALSFSRTVPYEKYLEILRQIENGFAEVRNEAARNWLGAASFDQLSEADQAVISKAVPLKIGEAESGLTIKK